MMKHRRIFKLTLILWLVMTTQLVAQQINVTGVVTSTEENQPLVGATVVVKNSNIAVATNQKGQYSIKVKKGDVITFSYLGTDSKQMTVGDKTTINVMLVQSSADIEMVVVGYTMTRKSDLTGSVQSVKSEDFMKSQPTSIEQGLQGRLAGVNIIKNDGAPGGGISVQIRGTNSFMGNTEPLYVLDGVPLSVSNDSESISFDETEVTSRNALSFLDPNDIESVEVLKDASATAIYGSRGSNGVVMITTKSGQKGSAKITFGANLTINTVSNKLRMLTGAEYAEYRNQAYINTSLINNGSFNPLGLPYLGAVGAVGSYIKGPEDYGRDPYYWQDAIFRTASSQNYNIGYSAANDNGDYSVGVAYLDQKGTVINSGYNRLSVNVKLNQNVRKWLKIGTTTNLSSSNSDMIKAATNNQNNGDEGVIRSALYFPSIYRIEEQPGYEEYQIVSNPIDYTKAMNKNKNYSIYTSNYANVTLAKGLVFRTLFSYKASMNFANRYFPRNLYEGRAVSGKSLAGDTQSESYLWDNIFMYNRTLNGAHNINATLGTSWEDYGYYNKQVSTQGFGYDGNNGWILQDGTNPQTPKSAKQNSQLFSVIARAAYTYKSKYYLTGTFRRDASSKFAKNNEVAYFPSIGVAWKATGEKFLSHNKIITNLKLRYSYGTSGNAGIGPYGSLLLLGNANYPFGNNVDPGYAIESTNPGNPNLKWETTFQHDLGMDLQLFNRLNIEIDYYNKSTKDLIQRKELASSTGLASVLYNIGEVNNSGLEVTINGNIIDNKNFRWSIGGNFSFNKNHVTNIGGANKQIFPNSLWNDLRPFIIQEGRPIGQLYGYIEDGIWSSRDEVIQSKQFQTIYPGYTVNSNTASTETIIKQNWIGEIRINDRDDNGSITESDQDFIGNVNPKFLYALDMNFRYKGFDFSFLFNGVYGNDIINMSSLRFHNIGQTRNIPKSILNEAWQPGKGGNNPKLYTTNSRDVYFSRRYIESGSYLKLRNVSIGYTLKRPIKAIRSARIFVSMNNLFTISSYSGYDPEVNSFGSNSSSRGIDAGGYPQSREFSFGINITL